MNDITTIAIASDHAGFALKQFLVGTLANVSRYYEKNKNENEYSANTDEALGVNGKYNIIDLGTDSTQLTDYPDYAILLADYMKKHKGIGILICGSGIGMSIAANRHHWIRAALCHNTEYAKLAREHNNANVLVLGAKYTADKAASEIVKTFLNTIFLQRHHLNRVQKL
ncbi:putative sugar phosphate isomerase RC0402 [Alphaproteobacteria bacterium]